MASQDATTFRDVLTGWAMPQLQPMIPDGAGGWIKRPPIGDTGLTARVLQVAFLGKMLTSLERRHIWYQGFTKFSPVFGSFYSGANTEWLMEVMRIMDHPRTRGRQNLTVALCHELFQADSAIDQNAKAEEQQKWDSLQSTYDGFNLRESRNRKGFHLDYSTISSPPTPPEDLTVMTQRLVDWFLAVELHHYKGHQMKFNIETAANRGRVTARHFRRMLFAYRRAEMGVTLRRKTSPNNLILFSLMKGTEPPKLPVS